MSHRLTNIIRHSEKFGKIISLLLIILFFESAYRLQEVEQLKFFNDLEKILTFTEWSIPANGTLILGVFDSEKKFNNIKQIYESKKTAGTQIEVKHIVKLDEVNSCNILYIGQLKSDELEKIFTKLNNRPIITISNTQGFAERGVMINFSENNNHYNFEINDTAAQKATIRFDGRLLMLAMKVY